VRGRKSVRGLLGESGKTLLHALIGYLFYEGDESEKNFITLLDMVNASDAREDDEDYKNPVDLMFEKLAKRNPEHFAVLQYVKFKIAAGVICSKRLNPLQGVHFQLTAAEPFN
jgi:hypothetical protein